MPGKFFNFGNNSSHGGGESGSGSTSTTRRRKRSLLGRKIHSENDLPLQGQSSSQQQSQQQQNHQLFVLPENVKTVLLAGTPECWSMSSNNAIVSPCSQSDAELLSFASSSFDDYGSYTANANNNNNNNILGKVVQDSPSSSSSSSNSSLQLGLGYDDDDDDDDDEDWQQLPPPPQQQQRRRRQEASLWPRFHSKTAAPKESSNKGVVLDEQQSEQQSTTADPSSMIVLCPSPVPTPTLSVIPPQEALNMWFNSVDALLKSHEMNTFVTTTRDVVFVVGGMAARTALLPVTLPLHWVALTKDFVGCTFQQLLQIALQQQQQKQLTLSSSEDSSGQIATTRNDDDSHTAASNSPLQGILYVIPMVLGAAGKIKDEIGSTVISLVTPPQASSSSSSSNNKKSDDEAALDRLRLPDFTTTTTTTQDSKQQEQETTTIPTTTAPSSPQRLSRADFTKYLMRVEDLGIAAPDRNNNKKNATVLYIDLSAEYGDRQLLSKVLDQMATRGIELTSDHAPAIPPMQQKSNNNSDDVEWKAEGVTAKLLRKKARQSPERWEETLRSDILVWSGTFKPKCGGSHIHRQYPMFLARGVVPNMSPRAFLELLWDNRRTHEYNAYCMGRDTVLSIDDEVLSSKKKKMIHTGTKVVKSETRVPFTSLSVTLLTVMHCRPLPGGPKEGYVVISRSLVSGMAGYHTKVEKSTVQKSKSEILWGVNVLRSVPNHPGQTELTSLSQVASSVLPMFLNQKIGLMGIEDFFRNIRSSEDSKAACTSSYNNNSDEASMMTAIQT